MTIWLFELIDLIQEREAGVGEAGRARDRESTQKEVNKLRGSIQTLTRSANPLGKLMDFLQEDVDSMQVSYSELHRKNINMLQISERTRPMEERK